MNWVAGLIASRLVGNTLKAATLTALDLYDNWRHP